MTTAQIIDQLIADGVESVNTTCSCPIDQCWCRSWGRWAIPLAVFMRCDGHWVCYDCRRERHRTRNGGTYRMVRVD